MENIRDRNVTEDSPMIINGAIGPEDDGYNPTQLLSADEAEQYHRHQVEALADAGVDMITAVTMTYAEEAIGITRAAQSLGSPGGYFIHGSKPMDGYLTACHSKTPLKPSTRRLIQHLLTI